MTTTVSLIRTCANWPDIVLPLARRYASGAWNGGDLCFRFRDGTVISVPGDPEARWPVLEVAVRDDYRLGRLLPRRASRDPVRIIDVGAHVGAFLLAVARRRRIAHAICVEPSPPTVAYLERNLAANGLAGCVEVVRAAVAGREGAVAFEELGRCNGGNALRSAADAPVTTVSGISFVSLRSRAADEVDICKLDCEGAEYAVVLESPGDVWQGVQSVVLEYHPNPKVGWDDLRCRLTALGFRVAWHRPSHVPGLGTATFVRC